TVLPARGVDEPFHLSANRTGVGAGVCGDKNDHGGLSAAAASHLTWNHRSYSGSDHWTFHVEDEEWHDRRRPKISIAFGIPKYLTGCEPPMKTTFVFAAVAGVAGLTFADIQDPPGNDYGPTRKLGRGISNFVIAPTEFFVTVNEVNQTEGNSAGAGYGVWKGARRA